MKDTPEGPKKERGKMIHHGQGAGRTKRAGYENMLAVGRRMCAGILTRMGAQRTVEGNGNA